MRYQASRKRPGNYPCTSVLVIPLTWMVCLTGLQQAYPALTRGIAIYIQRARIHYIPLAGSWGCLAH